jgi:hypothetical protein
MLTFLAATVRIITLIVLLCFGFVERVDLIGQVCDHRVVLLTQSRQRRFVLKRTEKHKTDLH